MARLAGSASHYQYHSLVRNIDGQNGLLPL